MRTTGPGRNDRKRRLRAISMPQTSTSPIRRSQKHLLCFVLDFVYVLLPIFLSVFGVSKALALEPCELLVVSNASVASSTPLARYYMKARNIPAEQLIELRVTDKETCGRREYEENVASPVRKYLHENDPNGLRIRCIVLMYGIPLEVSSPEPDPNDREEIKALSKKIKDLREKIRQSKREKKKSELRSLREIFKKERERFAALRKENHSASLDSEIALARNPEYPLSGWLPNPFFIGYKNNPEEYAKEPVLLVSRLDGPSPEIVERIIEDSLAAEKKGLRGHAYFDARYRETDKNAPSGYASYDASIHRAAAILRLSGILPVTLDDQKGLFKEGQCPDASLYCGWYSLARYIDAFSWMPGAVGFHVASAECHSLKGDRDYWCKRMLEDGAAAVVGPVGEPYTSAFPLPELFFGLLIRGDFTLAECYAKSTRYLSWRMVLIGDPLYNPFKNRH